MAKRSLVTLTAAERGELRALTKKGKIAARKLRRAHVLLQADARVSAEVMAAALPMGMATVERIRKRFVEEGFDAAVYRKPVTNVHRRKMTGDEEAHLIALFCSQAPEGHERWTLRMLADKMVELDIVDSVSHETIRQTLKKMNLNRGKRKNGVFPQSKMPLLSATWRTS